MIVTKAYITELPEEGSNIYKVEIPLMEDNTHSDAIFDAILGSSPGIYGGYKGGDCVIVTFEDDKYNTAIIVGKMFVEVPENADAYGFFNTLKVTGSVELPSNTKIGNYTVQDFVNLYNGVENASGAGAVTEDILKQYVQWTNTERGEGNNIEDIYADHVRTMTGEEYDKFVDDGTEHPDNFDEEEFYHTLYFLSSLPTKNYHPGGESSESEETISYEYNPVEYIGATGADQYIDTGVKLNKNSFVELEFKLTAKTLSKIDNTVMYNRLFGSRNATTGSETTNGFLTCMGYRSSGNDKRGYYIAYGNARQMVECKSSSTGRLKNIYNITMDLDNKHTLYFDRTNVYYDNLEYANASLYDFRDDKVSWGDSDYTCYLFAYNNAGTAAGQTSMNLYRCKIYEYDETSGEKKLVRDFVPYEKVTIYTIEIESSEYESSESSEYESSEYEPHFEEIREYEYGLLDITKSTIDAPGEFYPNSNKSVGRKEFIHGDKTYRIEVIANDSAGGSVSGSGYYTEGTEITISATPADGYIFTGWNDGSVLAERTIIVTDNDEFVAYFSSPKFNVLIDSEPDGSGNTEPPNGTITHTANENLTIRAYPNEGYQFLYWTVDGNVVPGDSSEDDSCTFKVVRNNMEVVAYFDAESSESSEV